MLIPTGLIVYKAERHHKKYPVDIKYGYYSDKLFLSPHTQENPKSSKFTHRYQRKIIQEILLKPYKNYAIKGKQLLSVVSKFNNIRKLTIRFEVCRLKIIESKESTIKAYQRIFRILKRIKTLVLFPLGEAQESSRTFKNILLMRNLERLRFIPFISYDIGSKTKGFLQVLKRSSKRRNWPKLKCLGMSPFAPDSFFKKTDQESSFIEKLQKLSEFLQDLKSIDDVYKCMYMQIFLSSNMQLSLKQAEKFWEVMKAVRSITLIEVGNVVCYPKVTRMVQDFQNLQNLYLNMDWLEEELDLGMLNNIEKLTLSMQSENGIELPFYKEALAQIPALKNIFILSLEFYGRNALSEELKVELARVIRNLENLKQLRLEFHNRKNQQNDGVLGSGLWLREVFCAIGEIKLLKKFFLSFSSFEFQDLKGLLGVLGQSLSKLTEISDLSLDIGEVDVIDEEELLLLCQNLSCLGKIESLSLKFWKWSLFECNILALLISLSCKSFPALSRLELYLSGVVVTKEAFELISKAIQNMKYLNEMRLSLGGELEEGIDLEILRNQMHKKLNGEIYYQPSVND